MAWGDYAITAVRYNDDETRIKKVERWKVEDQLISKEKIRRKKVVASIESGNKYTTAIKKDNGKWTPGDEVHTVEVDGEKFIRTDKSDNKEDNLEGLPKF